MNKRKLDKIGKSFEQDDYEIAGIIEYFVGVDGFSIESNPSHPDQLWSILDRIETGVLSEQEKDSMDMSEEQREFILHFLGKWKDDISPYCVRFESE